MENISLKDIATINPDQFVCQDYFSDVIKKRLFQWDYRDRTGKLYSGVAVSYEKAVEGARKNGYMGN